MMRKMEYAIVDIETTGGNAMHSRITEIAIRIHDGTEIIDSYETLVNPQKEIPDAIIALTGITNEMVRHAPLFDDIAQKVMEMLSGRTFVAHNVNFDYSFVRHQLKESGFDWSAKKLCTVRASRKIRPGFPSYSLGRLCASLGIPLNNRHRAGGDADATAVLFSRLLDWDLEDEIGKMLKKNAQDQRLPPNLPPEDFASLPETPGVYYFYNREKKVIYVGKAVNIRKRVASHFTGNNISSQRQNFLRDIHGISFEACATEFMALLLECTEIKKLWPEYNRALKKYEPKFGLYEYEARNGYRYLAVAKISKLQSCVEVFNSEYEGINLLLDLRKQFEIDSRFCTYGSASLNDRGYRTENADWPEVRQHNRQVENALQHLKNGKQSFGIIDKGRCAEERSCVWVEDGHFYGMGYITTDIPISDPSEIKEYVTPYQSSHYMMQLIRSYAKKFPSKVFSLQRKRI